MREMLNTNPSLGGSLPLPQVNIKLYGGFEKKLLFIVDIRGGRHDCSGIDDRFFTQAGERTASFVLFCLFREKRRYVLVNMKDFPFAPSTINSNRFKSLCGIDMGRRMYLAQNTNGYDCGIYPTSWDVCIVVLQQSF